MIVPTVGRVVWVLNRDVAPKSSQPEAALIAYVHSDRSINVGGVNAHGQPFHALSIPLLQDEDEAPTGIHATWVPLQKAQPTKADETGERTGSNYYERAVASGAIPPLTPVTIAPVEGVSDNNT